MTAPVRGRWTPRRLEAFDRRYAAVHEAAHYVVARHLGVRSRAAWIWRRADGDVEAPKLWLGSTAYEVRELRRLSQRRRTMIAVAGAIAEMAWQYRLALDDTLNGWESNKPHIDFWDGTPEAMSVKDWALAGLQPGEAPARLARAIDDVTKLLQPDGGVLWRPLCATARALIQHGVCETRPGFAEYARRELAAREERAARAFPPILIIVEEEEAEEAAP